MPRRTPFYSRTAALCESQSWQEWSGFLSANLYELNHIREYYAVRTSAALFDVSPLYKYHIHGRDALSFLNRVVTRDIGRCVVGQVMYSPWCDDDGKIIDDGTLARLAENQYRVTAADPSLTWFHGNSTGLDVTIEDVSEDLAALSLQGPTSRDLLQSLTDADLKRLKYFQLTTASVAGTPVTISRTGYTGDLGYELWVEPQHAEPLWDALMAAGQAYQLRAAGNLALDMARIEAGLLLTAVDFVSAKKTLFDIQKSSPLELGLGWTVKFDKGNFIGRAALLRERERGAAWATVGLDIQWEAVEAIYRAFGMPIQLPASAWASAVPVYANRRQIGKATSGMWSPMLKRYIALARLEAPYARPGTRVAVEITVETHRRQAEALVTETPFFNPERKKA